MACLLACLLALLLKIWDLELCEIGSSNFRSTPNSPATTANHLLALLGSWTSHLSHRSTHTRRSHLRLLPFASLLLVGGLFCVGQREADEDVVVHAAAEVGLLAVAGAHVSTGVEGGRPAVGAWHIERRTEVTTRETWEWPHCFRRT